MMNRMGGLRRGQANAVVRSSVAVLACVVFAAASSPVKVRQNASHSPTVVVVGDSITHLAAGSINAAISPHYHDFLVYRDGMRIDQMLPGLSLSLAEHAPVSAVVENLGTNDVIQGGRDADWRANWQRMLSITAKVPCVVLTTINLAADFYGKRPIAPAINREIKDLAKSDPRRYKVVDWWGFLVEAYKNQRADFFDYLQQELIHERPPGARWLAEEDRSALSDCGSSAEPSIIPPSERLLAS
jgi:hypothetical protein